MEECRGYLPKTPSWLVRSIAEGCSYEWHRTSEAFLEQALAKRWNELREIIRVQKERDRKRARRTETSEFGYICEYLGQKVLQRAFKRHGKQRCSELRYAGVLEAKPTTELQVTNGYWKFMTPYNIEFRLGDASSYHTLGEADMAVTTNDGDRVVVVDFGWLKKLNEKARQDETRFPKIQAMIEETCRSMEKLHIIFASSPERTGGCDPLKTPEGRDVEDCYVTYLRVHKHMMTFLNVAKEILVGTQRLEDFHELLKTMETASA